MHSEVYALRPIASGVHEPATLTPRSVARSSRSSIVHSPSKLAKPVRSGSLVSRPIISTTRGAVSFCPRLPCSS